MTKELISIRQAAKQGISRLRKPIWALPMDHLKIDKAHVIGYSMGGFITNKLVTTFPQRVLTATLGGSGWSPAEDTRLAFPDDLPDSRYPV